MDLLLLLVSRIRYSGPCGFSAEEDEATGATEAVLGLPRVGGTAALEAMLPKWGFRPSRLTTSVTNVKDKHSNRKGTQITLHLSRAGIDLATYGLQEKRLDLSPREVH